MDKLITGIIILAVVGLFAWLFMQPQDEEAAVVETAVEEVAAEPAEAAAGGSWVAVVGTGEEAHEAGSYSSYTECYQAVAEKVDVSVTAYSCSNQ